MKEEELDKVAHFFTFVQNCSDKKEAFLKGVLFGLGFIDPRKPNWAIIKELIQEGKDTADWLSIEQHCYEMNTKLKLEQIELVRTVLNKGKK